jgi:hypothetical protein
VVKAIRTLFFALGCVFLMLFLLLPNAPHFLHLFGWAALLVAYFLWVGLSYAKKSPLFTRGGLVLYEKEPRLYTTLHVVLALVGLFILLVFVTVNFM